jgi:hypothetical protein
MRAVLTTSLRLFAIAVFLSNAISGCGSSEKKAEEAAHLQAAAGQRRADFAKICGDPIRFPVSDQCVRLAGDQAPSLRRQSDLTAAVWRACSLTPSSAETIRQQLVAKGSAQTPVGQKMIGEMERTEQHSDSPCVAADLRDLDCVAGNSASCETARKSDSACTAWLADSDTQSRLRCIERAVHDQACMAKAAPDDSAAANYFSDSPAQAEDCRHIQDACLHSFDECANAQDALERFLKSQKTGPPPAQ